jgi:hypothetical protein
MKTTDYITANNTLRDKLSPDNEAYYEVILLHLRTDLRKNTKVAEDMLLQILQDLLDAQKSGVTAETYFGKDAKAVAEDIGANLPDMSFVDMLKEWWKIPFLFAVWPIAADIVTRLFDKITDGHTTVDALYYLNVVGLGVITMPIIMGITFYLVRRDVPTWVLGLSYVVMFTIVYVASLALKFVFPWHWWIHF